MKLKVAEAIRPRPGAVKVCLFNLTEFTKCSFVYALYLPLFALGHFVIYASCFFFFFFFFFCKKNMFARGLCQKSHTNRLLKPN